MKTLQEQVKEVCESVLVYKPQGVKMLDRDVLDAMMMANRDGFGFVANITGCYKTTNYRKFLDALSHVGDYEKCILHFRFATHGSVCTKNSHPFKAKIEGQNDVYFAHNGVLSVATKGDMTDSETAFKYHFVPQIKKYGLFSEQLDYEVYDIKGSSKFAFMQGDDVRLFGDFQTYDGCLFSNLNFMNRYGGYKSRLSMYEDLFTEYEYEEECEYEEELKD